MFENLTPSLLLPTELSVTATRLLGAAVEALPTDPTIQKLNTVISADVDALDATLGRERTSNFTALVAQSNQEREEAFVAMRDFAKASSNRSDPDVAAAGELIHDIFQRRGLTLYRLGYTRQSAALNLLLEELSTPEARKALEVIQAGSWVDDLRAAHVAFERTYIEKVSAEAQQDFPSLRDARGRLGDHVETLLGSVEVLRQSIEQDGEDAELTALGELVEQLNEIIAEVMTVARARRTRQSNADSPEEAREEAVVATAS